MIQNNKLILLLVFISSAFFAKAEGVQDKDSLYTKYKIDEEWYVLAQGGVNYIAAENTRFVNFWDVISPQTALSLGKRISPIWGVRMQLVAGKDRGVYYAHDKNSPTFSFNHYGILGVGTFNLTKFFQQKKNIYKPDKWEFNLLFGAGTMYTAFGFTKNINEDTPINLNNNTYLTAFGGAEIAKRFSQNWELNLELSTNWMNKNYNGQVSSTNSKFNADGLINLLVGIRFTFDRANRNTRKKEHYYKSEKPDTAIVPVKRNANLYSVKQNSTKTKQSSVVVTEQSYSFEDLLEMVENHEPIHGKRLSLTEHLVFNYGKVKLKPFDMIYLDKIVELMEKENFVLIIKGFYANPHAVSADHLSEKRVKAVRNYLMEHGIDRDRLVYQCLELSDIPSNKTALDDAAEQTVEFGILYL